MRVGGMAPLGGAEHTGQLDQGRPAQPHGTVEIPEARIHQARPFRRGSAARVGAVWRATPDLAMASTMRPSRPAGNTGIRNPGRLHARGSPHPGPASHRRTAVPHGWSAYVAISIKSPLSVRRTSCLPLTATIRALAARRPARAARRNVRPFGSRSRGRVRPVAADHVGRGEIQIAVHHH